MANYPMRSKLISGVLFVTCAIPGVFVFLISVTIFGWRLLDHNVKRPGWVVLVIAILTGAVLILLGIGRLSRPAYLLVFFSIPISGCVSAWVYLKIDPYGGPGGIIAFFGFIVAIAYVTLWGVNRYYNTRE